MRNTVFTKQYIVACLLKARIVKLAETAVARDGCVNTTVVGNGSVAVT
jgi:hypothetical protein